MNQKSHSRQKISSSSPKTVQLGIISVDRGCYQAQLNEIGVKVRETSLSEAVLEQSLCL